MTGQTVSHYRILEKIGEGGMGVVYKAEDLLLHRLVALKMLPVHAAGQVERLRREARAAASLNHPNICTIYEINDEHGFIAMEYVDGNSVKDKVKERPLPLSDALAIGIQVCAGLQAAHAKGIVHRDIKPANLMVTAQGQVKVMDFGLASAGEETRLTNSGIAVGTPAYMSPEQVEGRSTDRRTDIWSMGLTLYEMLTASPAFRGETHSAVTYGIIHAKPEPPSALRGGLPKDTDRIVEKALRKTPDERYQHVDDLLVDLQALANGQPLVFGRKRAMPWLYAAMASVFLVAGGLAVSRSLVTQSVRSIAIVPLRSLNQEAADSFLGLGIADALITRMGQTSQLRVRPISAVSKYAKGEVDPLEAGRQQKAEAVLEGSLQRSGERLRVSVHLMKTETGGTIWARSFDVKSAELFALQDQVALLVAQQLQLKLDRDQRRNLEKHDTSNTAAFEYYSKAVHHLGNRSDAEEVLQAIELLKRAIALDPNYALARAKLGFAYAFRAIFHVTDSTLIAEAKRELAMAEKLNPRIADVHVARASMLLSQYERWQTDAAIREMRMAQDLDPNAGHSDLAAYLWHLGLEREAERHHLLALENEPDSITVKQTYVDEFYMSLRPDEGAAAERRYLQVSPRVDFYLQKGMLSEAARLIDRNRLADPGSLSHRIDQAALLVLQEKMEDARREIAVVETELERIPRQRQFHHQAYSVARVRARLNDRSKAFYWLRTAVEEGFPQYPMMERDRMLDPVRSDRDIAQLLASVKSQWQGYKREFGDGN